MKPMIDGICMASKLSTKFNLLNKVGETQIFSSIIYLRIGLSN
jgi:uncharacterized membrane protein YuzA (DUF378 family)